MKIKQIFQSIFSYEPKKEYKFSLSQNTKGKNNETLTNNYEKFRKVFPTLAVNLEYMKTRYNLMINSDIVLREFTLNARGKQYNAFLMYIDGMINSEIMDKFVLEPLMMRNRNNLYDGSQSKVISEAVANNITVRKVKKFDLASYIMNCLMPQNTLKQETEFDKIISRY